MIYCTVDQRNIKECKSWRILLLCAMRQFPCAQRNINYEKVLTADDNTDMYALMLNDGMRDFVGSRRRVLDIWDADIAQ